MDNPLVMKLEQFRRLPEEDRRLLEDLTSGRQRRLEAREDIIREGEHSPDIHIVMSGLACRYKILANGGRQIMAFLVPGDLCDVEVFVLAAMDHNISALSETTCVVIPAQVIEDLLTESSALTRALWWSTMTDSAILRERIIDHGSRDARERMAHLFYELLVRYRIVGETTDNALPFRMTQDDLAAATGISTVHVNRTLQELRSEGLIELKGKVLTVLDAEGLREVAQFNANYLHLNRTEKRDPEVAGRAGDLIEPETQGLIQGAVGTVRSALKKS